MLVGRVGTGMRFVALSVVFGSLAACTTTGSKTTARHSKEYFSEKTYGVAASPRVVSNGPVPKGGGRDMVGKPYLVKGKQYVPRLDKNYDRVGYASWYGSAFHGRLTANGEVYDQNSLTAAHPTFPLPSYARVTNLENGSSVIVRVNDRGPYERGRIVDLSNKTASLLDMKSKGTAKVRVQYVGRARMDGQDEAFLMASYVPKGGRIPSQVAPGVMVASADSSLPVGALAPIPVLTKPPALAMAEPARQTAAFSNLDTVVVLLPEFGPVPMDRPSFVEMASRETVHYASSYTEADTRSIASTPFRSVMGPKVNLDADMVRLSYERQHDGSDS
jgi:rare lipoprotein A